MQCSAAIWKKQNWICYFKKSRHRKPGGNQKFKHSVRALWQCQNWHVAPGSILFSEHCFMRNGFITLVMRNLWMLGSVDLSMINSVKKPHFLSVLCTTKSELSKWSNQFCRRMLCSVMCLYLSGAGSCHQPPLAAAGRKRSFSFFSRYPAQFQQRSNKQIQEYVLP